MNKRTKTIETRAMEAFIAEYIEAAFKRRPRNRKKFRLNGCEEDAGRPLDMKGRVCHEWSTDRIMCFRIGLPWIVANNDTEVDVHEIQIQRQPDDDGRHSVVLRFLCEDADYCVDLWDAACELGRMYRESDRLTADKSEADKSEADANNLKFRTTDMEGC